MHNNIHVCDGGLYETKSPQVKLMHVLGQYLYTKYEWHSSSWLLDLSSH